MLRSRTYVLAVATICLASCRSSQVEPTVNTSKFIDPAGRVRATLQPGWQVRPTARGGIQFLHPKLSGAITLIMLVAPIAPDAAGDDWKPLLDLEEQEVTPAGKGRSSRKWVGSHGPLMIVAIHDYDDANADAEKAEAEPILASVEFSARGSSK